MAPQQHLVAACAALATLTFVVGLRMLAVRVAEMRARRIHPQAVALSAQRAQRLDDSRASDNYNHLFELPVLFYAGVLLAAHIGVSDMVSLALAWAFVGLRAVHSAVHCTFNHVMTRFVPYALATLVLIAFWARLAFALAAA